MPPPYRSIVPILAHDTVLLDGHHLNADDVVRVARFGAKVALTPDARQRSADAYGVMDVAVSQRKIAASFMREHRAASFIADDNREPDADDRRHNEQ